MAEPLEPPLKQLRLLGALEWVQEGDMLHTARIYLSSSYALQLPDEPADSFQGQLALRADPQGIMGSRLTMQADAAKALFNEHALLLNVLSTPYAAAERY